MHLLLLLFAALGHAFLWIGLANRLHALGIRRRIIAIITVIAFLCAALLPLGIGWWLIERPSLCPAAPSLTTTPHSSFIIHPSSFIPPPSPPGPAVLDRLIGLYLLLCLIVAPVTLLRTVFLRACRRPPTVLRFQRRRPAAIDLALAAASPQELRHHFLTRLPLNESLQLEIAESVLEVPRLPPALDGLTIVHLSDLHFTGRIGKAYFREVVRTCNELRADLAVVTGDLVDRPACIEWIAETLGQLTARAGVYFILGNHDLLVDSARLRRTMVESGLVDLGGRWRQIEIGQTPLVLLGSEGPWIDGAANLHDGPPPAPVGPLRIAIAHTPDQLAWARAHQADLLLTGHTHGGQVCIPPLGAIFSPTAQGVKYISGVFYAPPTILHVTRGISSDIPIRWNCRPEIAHLKLRPCAPASPSPPS